MCSYQIERSYPLIEGFSVDDFRSTGSKDTMHFCLNLDENVLSIEGSGILVLHVLVALSCWGSGCC